MKQLLIILLLLAALDTFAIRRDTTIEMHQLVFSVTNALSIGHAEGTLGLTDQRSTPYYPFSKPNSTASSLSILPHQNSYSPFYSFHLRAEYSLGLSRVVRLETGVGYLLQGLIIHYSYSLDGNTASSTTHAYLGCLTLPLHVKIRKETSAGGMTAAFGPVFTVPLHQIYSSTDVMVNGVAQPSVRTHEQVSRADMSYSSIMGFDLKVGYEKNLSDRSYVNVGPALYLGSFVPLHRGAMPDTGVTRLPLTTSVQAYIGLDVAFGLGMSKK